MSNSHNIYCIYIINIKKIIWYVILYHIISYYILYYITHIIYIYIYIIWCNTHTIYIYTLYDAIHILYTPTTLHQPTAWRSAPWLHPPLGPRRSPVAPAGKNMGSCIQIWLWTWKTHGKTWNMEHTWKNTWKKHETWKTHGTKTWNKKMMISFFGKKHNGTRKKTVSWRFSELSLASSGPLEIQFFRIYFNSAVPRL